MRLSLWCEEFCCCCILLDVLCVVVVLQFGGLCSFHVVVSVVVVDDVDVFVTPSTNVDAAAVNIITMWAATNGQVSGSAVRNSLIAITA